MKKWFLREHLGVCSVEDAKTKGLVTVNQDSLGQLLPISRKPQKSLTARVLLKVLQWAPYPFSQVQSLDPTELGESRRRWWGQLNSGSNSSYSRCSSPFFGTASTWEARALLVLWKISFQSSGGWRADYTRPLRRFRHMETESKCWGLELRDKRLIQKSG